jgi:hypothetical protein
MKNKLILALLTVFVIGSIASITAYNTHLSTEKTKTVAVDDRIPTDLTITSSKPYIEYGNEDYICAKITGRLTDVNGNPLKNRKVEIANSYDGMMHWYEKTDDDGCFVYETYKPLKSNEDPKNVKFDTYFDYIPVSDDKYVYKSCEGEITTSGMDL